MKRIVSAIVLALAVPAFAQTEPPGAPVAKQGKKAKKSAKKPAKKAAKKSDAAK